MSEQAEEVVPMEDTILATLRGINEREELDPEQPGQEQQETEPGKVDKPRGEHGHFAKKELAEPKAGDEAAGEPEQGAAGAETGVEVPVRADGKPVDLNRPPSEWKPGAKAEWAKLTPTVRSEILRRETDAYKKVQEVLPEADLGRNIRASLEPYRQALEMDGGGDMVKAVAALGRAAHTLRFGTPMEKHQCMVQIADAYGIPLPQGQQGAQGQQGQASQQGPIHDPRVDAILRNMQSAERARAADMEARASAATQNFIGATDDKGQPRYPFVDNVLDDMVARVQLLRTQNPSLAHEKLLDQAYEAAVWANPETRPQMIQQQQQTQLAQTREANLRKVADAKRAAAGNLPRRGSVPGAEPVGKMEDTILETYRQLTSG